MKKTITRTQREKYREENKGRSVTCLFLFLWLEQFRVLIDVLVFVFRNFVWRMRRGSPR